MGIKTENIRVIITASGIVFVGQKNEMDFNNKMRLEYPFRIALNPSTGLFSVSGPVLKEEWIVIDMTGAVECQVNPRIEEQYIKCYNKEFGSGLIVPDGKKIIV